MEQKDFSISLSLKEAFKGFGRWWLVLCSISFVILISQSWIPKLLLDYSGESYLLRPYLQAFNAFKHELANIATAGTAFVNLKNKLIEITSVLGPNLHFQFFLGKMAIIFALLFLVICLLYIITIVISIISVSKKDTHNLLKKSLKKSPILSLSYFVLSLIKVLPFCLAIIIPFAFFMFELCFSTGTQLGIVVVLQGLMILFIALFVFIFGIYLYVRFYFTGFIITESSANPFKAIKKSWNVSKNHTYKIFLAFLITLIIDLISIISVIGFIPANSIKYTFRASIYRQLTW